MTSKRIVTTAEMIAVLGISKARLNEMARQGKIPRGPGPNQWDVDAAQAAVGRNLDLRQVSPARGEAAPKTIGRRQADSALTGQNSPQGSPARGSLAAA